MKVSSILSLTMGNAMRKLWPFVVKTYWDPWLDVPIIKPRQEELDLVFQLRLTEPGDLRPALQADYDRLRSAVVFELGCDKLFYKYMSDRVVFLNKVPHWDLMYEVVVSGNVIGQLYYDPFIGRWRFRLTYQGAYLSLHDGLVDAVRADPPFYTGKTVKTSFSTSSRQVVVVDHKGFIRGIGEVSGSGEVTLVKTFHDRTPPVETSNKPSTIQDVLKRNLDGLRALEEKSVKFLNRVKKRYENLKPIVSYSGGKDSLVALDLATKAYGEVEILFNDTGLEMPETLKNVEVVAERYAGKLHVAAAGDIFWRAVDLFGPPGKDYRWCCKITKLVPIAKLSKTTWPSGGLNIVGQRAYESLDRASSPLIWRNKWIRHMISTTPIQYWSQLAVWLYIFNYKLPYNRLYEHGFDRLGCYMCPSCALAEFEEVKKLHPELWNRWESVLLEWKNKLSVGDEWLRLGLWRWLSPATAKKRIARNVKDYSTDWHAEYLSRLLNNRIKLAPISVEAKENVFKVQFSKQLVPREYLDLFLANVFTLGFHVVNTSPLTLEKAGSTFMINENVLEAKLASSEAIEDLVDILKVLYRMYGCVYCGSCVLWTSRGSVTLTLRGPLPRGDMSEENKRVYIEVCPISDQLVEKVAASLILGNYKAFKRKTRRRI